MRDICAGKPFSRAIYIRNILPYRDNFSAMDNWITQLGYRPLLLRALAVLFLSIPPQPAMAGRIEAGTFTSHTTLGGNRTPNTIAFQQPFDVPPIVVAIPSGQGGDAATIRITNVTTTGFDELAIEPDPHDGRHVAMDIYYVALEPGRHVLPDGRVIEAGHSTISNVQFGTGFTGGSASWANVGFSSALPTTPVVLHQLQTANSETRNVASQSSQPFITSIARNPSTSGFQLAMERSQTNSGPWPGAEKIGWIAFPSGNTGTFLDDVGSSVSWATVTSSASIRGWSDGCSSVAHGLSASNPVVVAKKNSRNNPDGGWFRYCAVSGSAISLVVDEDLDQDSERSIAASQAEQAAIIAFSRPFHANLKPDLNVMKLSIVTNDGQGGNFAIPGATVDYLIVVTNSGTSAPDNNTVTITEPLPDELNLMVTGFSGPSTSPVLFQQGSPSSSLTCTFISLASTSDCLSFSTDGTNYNYMPVDSGDGTDPAVRYIRVKPSGTMHGNSGSGTPNFSLLLRARVN